MDQLTIFGNNTETHDIYEENILNEIYIPSSSDGKLYTLLTSNKYINHINLLQCDDFYTPPPNYLTDLNLKDKTKYYQIKSNIKFHRLLYPYMWEYFITNGHDYIPRFIPYCEDIEESSDTQYKLIKGSSFKTILTPHGTLRMALPIDLLAFNLKDSSINPYVSYISMVTGTNSGEMSFKLYININGSILTNAQYNNVQSWARWTSYDFWQFIGSSSNNTHIPFYIMCDEFYTYSITQYNKSYNTINLYQNLNFKLINYIYNNTDYLCGNIDFVTDTTEFLDDYTNTGGMDSYYPYPFNPSISNTGTSVYDYDDYGNTIEHKYKRYNIKTNQNLTNFTLSISDVKNILPGGTLAKPYAFSSNNNYVNSFFFISSDQLALRYTNSSGTLLIQLPQLNESIRYKTDLTVRDYPTSNNTYFNFKYSGSSNTNDNPYISIPVAIITHNVLHKQSNGLLWQSANNPGNGDTFACRIIGYIVISELHYNVQLNKYTKYNPNFSNLLSRYKYVESDGSDISDITYDKIFFEDDHITPSIYKFNENGLLTAYSYTYTYSYSF